MNEGVDPAPPRVPRFWVVAGAVGLAFVLLSLLQTLVTARIAGVSSAEFYLRLWATCLISLSYVDAVVVMVPFLNPAGTRFFVWVRIVAWAVSLAVVGVLAWLYALSRVPVWLLGFGVYMAVVAMGDHSSSQCSLVGECGARLQERSVVGSCLTKVSSRTPRAAIVKRGACASAHT